MWRVLLTGDVDPYRNMAFEESLLLSVESGSSPNTLRFWRNKRCVVIGLSQNKADELDLEKCHDYGVHILKRFTGGGTVYHDLGNLNWTVVCRMDIPVIKKIQGVYGLYERLSNPVVEALQDLDINAEFKPPNSIYLQKKKISGLAMCIKKSSILVHGTLLVNADINLLNRSLKKLKDPVTNISFHTKSTFQQSDIIEKIIKKY